jgi:hypothetical protein
LGCPPTSRFWDGFTTTAPWSNCLRKRRRQWWSFPTLVRLLPAHLSEEFLRSLLSVKLAFENYSVISGTFGQAAKLE